MRKFTVVFILMICVICSVGCTKDIYTDRISELRQDIYTGNVDGATITAYYGFKETPYAADGNVAEKIYGYTFYLSVIPDEVKRSFAISDGDKKYKADFSLDEITGEYKAFVESQKHFKKSFTVDYICGSEIKNVTLNSIVPENCIAYSDAMRSLTEKQRALFDLYTVDGEFCAEIYMRVFVKNDTPYWYVALVRSDKTKALLIDGSSGELLAVKDIM